MAQVKRGVQSKCVIQIGKCRTQLVEMWSLFWTNLFMNPNYTFQITGKMLTEGCVINNHKWLNYEKGELIRWHFGFLQFERIEQIGSIGLFASRCFNTSELISADCGMFNRLMHMAKDHRRETTRNVTLEPYSIFILFILLLFNEPIHTYKS